DVVRVALGYRYACALHTAGDVTCWGMLGRDAEKMGARAPAKISGLAGAVEIGVGQYEACGRTRTGDVLCWGEMGAPKSASKPVLVKSGAARMAVGPGALCVIARDGVVSCAGGAASGAFGTPLTEWKAKPSLSPAIDVAAQVGLVCAVRSDGTLACEGP